MEEGWPFSRYRYFDNLVPQRSVAHSIFPLRSLLAVDLIPRGRRSFRPRARRHRVRSRRSRLGGGGGGGGLGDGQGLRGGGYRQKDLHGGSTASQIT